MAIRHPNGAPPDHDRSPMPAELAGALSTMSTILLDDETVEAMLELIVSLARASMSRVDDASVSVLHGDALDTTSATSDGVRGIDGRQYETGEGPCVAAIRDGLTHNVCVAAEIVAWPNFAPAASAQGFGSVLSTPLVAHERRFGAINMYSHDDHTFPDGDVAAARVFADHAAVLLSNAMSFAASEETNRQLQTALETARTIGRAQGVLMARQNCCADDAFDMLRRASQRSNRKVREIAEEIIAPLEEPARPER